MTRYVVTLDEVPIRTTSSQRDACAMFDSVVRSRRYRQAAVVAVTAPDRSRRVLREAWQGF